MQLINCELKQRNIYLFVNIFFQKIFYHDSINKNCKWRKHPGTVEPHGFLNWRRLILKIKNAVVMHGKVCVEGVATDIQLHGVESVCGAKH